MDIDYILKRSNRKTIAIHIRDGLVEVRAPHKASIESIERFIRLKEKWIEQKLVFSVARLEKRERFELRYGDYLLYRGEDYPIRAHDGGSMGFDDDGFYIPPNLSPKQIKDAVVKIYKVLAKRDITGRVYEIGDFVSLKPSAVKINSAKSRWGSCSARGSLNFSWLLIMADDEVIDYIVLHELMHMVEMNHSAHFWTKVKLYMPDYEVRKARLKVLQKRLSEEDWTL